MSHNSVGKQAGYDGTKVEFIAKNLVCETLNGTAVPSGGLSQTLDEVCTGGTNNVTTRQVIANGLVSTNGRVFLQQQPLPAGSQLSNIVTFANGELKTQTLTKEIVLPDGLQSVCDIKNTTTTAIVGNGLQSTSTISAATTVQAGTALQVTTKPATIPSVANQEVLVWDNNIIKSILLNGPVRKPTSLYGESGFLIQGLSGAGTYIMTNPGAYKMQFPANFVNGGIYIETMKVGYKPPFFVDPARSGFFYISGDLIPGFECQNYTLDLSVSQIWNPEFPQGTTPPLNTTNYYYPVNYQLVECGDNSGGNTVLNTYQVQIRLSENNIDYWEDITHPNITVVYKFRFTLRKI